MDSVTQAALGGAVGLAVAGRHLGPRKAVLAGAVLGTLPDLDVLLSHGDPVSDFVLHRGATHSLIVQAAVTPLFGEALRRLFAGLRDRRATAWATVFLCFSTHALLDGMTIYGTRLLWPVWEGPLGVGSVFIIDPLYTLPLVVAVVWALCLRAWTPGLRRAVTVALLVSTGYLGWSVAAQRVAEARGTGLLARLGVTAERAWATPTPFNTLFWRVIAIDGPRYWNVYVPLLGPEDTLTAYSHRRLAASAACGDPVPAAEVLADFTKGFYRTEVIRDGLVVSDLRMGLTPNYVFRFRIADLGPGGVREAAPSRLPTIRDTPGDIDWLIAGVLGRRAVRPAESVAIAGNAVSGATDAVPTC